ncbi:MAG: DUF4974 domain-containing protein [Odoribacter sp.]
MNSSTSDIFKLAAILVKSFREELSPEERLKLDEWLQADDKNKKLYARMQQESWLEEKMREALQIESVKECTAFIAQYKRQRRVRLQRIVFKSVAMVVLLFSLGGGLLYLAHFKQIETTVVADRLPVSEKNAILVLGNGEKMILKETDPVMEKKQAGAVLNIVGKSLSYCQMPDTTVQTTEYNKLSIPRGGEYCLTLADGTGVWLNSESSLHYPVTFTGEKRIVYLEGEAYFKVAKNAQMPFVVVAGGTETEVLGTEFNLRAYPDETVISTTLVEGSVLLRDTKKNHPIVLLPGEQGNVVKTNGLISKHPVDSYLYTAWKDGRLVFRSSRMEELLKELSRWYDVEVFYQNPEAREIRYTGDMCKTEHIDDLLKIIEGNGLVSFERSGRSLIVKIK